MATVYELTVFDADDTAELFDVSTDPAHARPYLKVPTAFPEQEINFAKGTASIAQVNLQVVDVPTDPTDQDTGYLTGQLADSGFSALNGHRAILTENIDGAGATKIIDGVIRAIRLLETFATYEIEVRDIRERERKTKAFARTTTPTLLPRGVLAGYGVQFDVLGSTFGTPIGPTLPLKATYESVAGNEGVFVFDVNVAGAFEETILTTESRAALESVTELAGQPEVLVHDLFKVLWRDFTTKGAYTELEQIAFAHPDLADPANRDTHLETLEGSLGSFRVNNAISGDTLPSDAQVCDFIVQYDGPVTEDWRFHLQDLTAGELLRNLYRGDYSVEDPRIRYNSTAVLALTTPVRMRLGEPVDDVREWAEKNIYPIVHAAPTLNVDGEIAPITYLLPDAAESPVALTDANCRPAGGGWSQASDDAINLVTVNYERVFRTKPLFPGLNSRAVLGPTDTLSTRKVSIEHRIPASITLLGEQELKVDSVLLSALGTKDGAPIFGDVDTERGAQVAERITKMATDRFALGGQHFALQGDRTDPDVEGLVVGSWVTVGVSWMPDYGSGERNLNRLAQVIGRRNLSAAWMSLTLIDAGTAQVALGAPTIGVLAVDAAGVVSVPVTALAAGSEGRVDYAIAGSEPAAGAKEWTFLGRVSSVTTTLTTPQIAPNNTVWIRSRGENVGRRPSVYVTKGSIAVGAISRVLGVSIRVDAAGIPTVAWDPNADTLGVRIAYEVHDPDVIPTLATTVDVDAADLEAAIGTTVFEPQVITAKVTAYPGWSSPNVTGSAGASTTEREVGAAVANDAAERPTVTTDSTATDATTETFTITGTAAAGRGPTITVKHRERTGGGAWGAFSAWFTSPKTGIVVTRDGKKHKTLQVVARDESFGNLESLPVDTIVDPSLDVVGDDGVTVVDNVEFAGDLFVLDTDTIKVGTVASPSVLTKVLRSPGYDFHPVDESTPFARISGSLRVNTTGTNEAYQAMIRLPKGVTITAFKARMWRQVAGDIAVVSLFRVNDAGSTTGLGTVTHTTTAAWQEIEDTGPDQLVGDEAYIMEWTAKAISTNNDARILWAEVSYSMPSYDKAI